MTMMPSSQQPSLPDSLSPCSNVRRSCSVLMKDEPCPSFDGANNNTTGGSRSVIIDSASAMDDLADKISHSIMEKYQRAQPEAHTADATSTSVTTNSAAAISEDVNECIDNLDFASWDADGWHYTGKNYSRPHLSKEEQEIQRFERVALYVMVLDCINFCFWPVDGSNNETRGAPLTNLLEYEHLASALKNIAEADDILPQKKENSHNSAANVDSEYSNSTVTKAEISYAFAPQNLINLDTKKLLDILYLVSPTKGRKEEGEDFYKDDAVYSVPNIEERCRLIIEMGQSLLTFHCGSATHFISKANKSADMLVHLILQSFPGFRDTSVHNNRWVAFYKRAQILVADLWAALGGVPQQNDHKDDDEKIERTILDHCYFYDMDKITTFADYRVPQLLRHLDVLQYSLELSRQVDDKIELVPFCADELYIRAATVVAVDELVDRVKMKLREKSKSNEDPNLSLVGLQAENVNAVKMDWYLWNIGEKLDRNKSLGPHHRVKTIFY